MSGERVRGARGVRAYGTDRSGSADTTAVATVVYLREAAAARRPAAAPVTPHRRAWRPHTMFYVGLVGLAGALSADPDGSAGRLCGAWLVPTLGWVAGHYGADLVGGGPDSVAAPRRSVRSGRMRPATGLTGMVACAAAGGALALALNRWTVPLVAVGLFVALAHDTVLTARGLAGNLARGGLTALAFLFGTMTVRHLPATGLVVAATVFLVHDAAADLVGTLGDVEADRRSGHQTFPVRHGIAATLGVMVASCLLWLALAAAAPVYLGGTVHLGGTADGRLVFWGLFSLAAASAGTAVATAVRAGTRPVPPRAARAHDILSLERLVLACAFVGLAAGPLVALALLVTAGALTMLLRRSARSECRPGSAGDTVGPGRAARPPRRPPKWRR